MTAAPLVLFVPAFLVAGALSLSWNGLAFTATAELAGRSRAGAALGFQQTALAVASGFAPPVFALLVESTSWAVAFGLAAVLPLAGAGLMRTDSGLHLTLHHEQPNRNGQPAGRGLRR